MRNSSSIKLAKSALHILPRNVAPDDWAHSDYFSEAHLATLPPEMIAKAMFAAADERRRVEEEDRFIEVFFGPSVREYMAGKRVLDFACYFGGTAIAWERLCGTGHVSGFDVSPIYIEGASAYAAHVGSSTEFRHGSGENAPFSDEAFDTIVAIDVFEQVRDIRKCLDECRRMLVKGEF